MADITFQDFIQALRLDFALLVHDNNYKDGAFKDKINIDTHPVDALNIFIASPLLSAQQKTSLMQYRDIFTKVQNTDFSGCDQAQLLKITAPLKEIINIFEADMSECQSILPTTIRTNDATTSNLNKTERPANDNTWTDEEKRMVEAVAALDLSQTEKPVTGASVPGGANADADDHVKAEVAADVADSAAALDKPEVEDDAPGNLRGALPPGFVEGKVPGTELEEAQKYGQEQAAADRHEIVELEEGAKVTDGAESSGAKPTQHQAKKVGRKTTKQETQTNAKRSERGSGILSWIPGFLKF